MGGDLSRHRRAGPRHQRLETVGGHRSRGRRAPTRNRLVHRSELRGMDERLGTRVPPRPRPVRRHRHPSARRGRAARAAGPALDPLQRPALVDPRLVVPAVRPPHPAPRARAARAVLDLLARHRAELVPRRIQILSAPEVGIRAADMVIGGVLASARGSLRRIRRRPRSRPARPGYRPGPAPGPHAGIPHISAEMAGGDHRSSQEQ